MPTSTIQSCMPIKLATVLPASESCEKVFPKAKSPVHSKSIKLRPSIESVLLRHHDTATEMHSRNFF